MISAECPFVVFLCASVPLCEEQPFKITRNQINEVELTPFTNGNQIAGGTTPEAHCDSVFI